MQAMCFLVAPQVPNGVVPAIELDGKLFTESAQIAALLEEEFPERPLFPPKGTACCWFQRSAKDGQELLTLDSSDA